MCVDVHLEGSCVCVDVHLEGSCVCEDVRGSCVCRTRSVHVTFACLCVYWSVSAFLHLENNPSHILIHHLLLKGVMFGP